MLGNITTRGIALAGAPSSREVRDAFTRASILGVGYLMPVFYLTASLFFGRDAGPNQPR